MVVVIITPPHAHSLGHHLAAPHLEPTAPEAPHCVCFSQSIWTVDDSGFLTQVFQPNVEILRTGLWTYSSGSIFLITAYVICQSAPSQNSHLAIPVRFIVWEWDPGVLLFATRRWRCRASVCCISAPPPHQMVRGWYCSSYQLSRGDREGSVKDALSSHWFGLYNLGNYCLGTTYWLLHPPSLTPACQS